MLRNELQDVRNSLGPQRKSTGARETIIAIVLPRITNGSEEGGLFESSYQLECISENHPSN